MDMVEPVCSLKLISSLHALSKHDRVSLEPWLILLSARIKDIYAITHLAWTFWDMVSLHSPEPRDSRSAIASQVHSTRYFSWGQLPVILFPSVLLQDQNVIILWQHSTFIKCPLKKQSCSLFCLQVKPPTHIWTTQNWVLSIHFLSF